MAFLDKFRRITSNGDYFAEIDGLRFIAIFTVILFHMKSTVDMIPQNVGYFGNLIKPIFDNGWQGVELFFAISGFIIGLPFAKYYIEGRKPVNLKSFFYRRITRLEPPYMIAIIAYTIFSISMGIDNPESKSIGLLSSIFYMNNIIFGLPEFLPIGVVWSLEIEIQFYILAIFFTKVYKLNKLKRRSIMLSVIYVMPLITTFFPFKTHTLYTYLHFFFIGLLLADLYLDKEKIKINKYLGNILGGLSLFALIYVNHGKNLPFRFIFISSIIVFYYLSMHNNLWKKVMSFKPVAIIGGMCYSIYLLHTIVIGAFKGLTFGLVIGNSYMLTLVINAFIVTLGILAFSGIYFLLIEKPCMDKNWPQKLASWFKSKAILFSTYKPIPERD